MVGGVSTYRNPVYDESFPDPFVLKYRGEYWAYCTGIQDDGRCFGVLRSADLVRWERCSNAMAPLSEPWTEYWAPEVLYLHGVFYLYYSVGNENHMHLRVATSSRPGGPFVDSGRRLTREEFAIDAHVFTEDDGRRYLFYATDFVDHPRIGTGTVRDRLLDPFTTAGRPQPVTRARFDWQIYDPRRAAKDWVCWHTLEGPFVLAHKGRRYQMFSAGNWKNPSYGVAYAVTDTIETDKEWDQPADGVHTQPILGTVPGEVIGPGHNSVIRGPDNLQLYCVYHRWTGDRRAMAIDRLEWVGDRLIVLGPTYSPEIAPNLPIEPVASGDLRPVGTQTQTPNGFRFPLQIPAFICEISFQWEHNPGNVYPLGICLEGLEGLVLDFSVQPESRTARIKWYGCDGCEEQEMPLPAEFNPLTTSLLRMAVNGREIDITLNATDVQWHGMLARQPTELLLPSEMRHSCSWLAVTTGWEDRFDRESLTPADLGWESADVWTVTGMELCFSETTDATVIWKRLPLADYEMVVNIRLTDTHSDGCYGFYPVGPDGGNGMLFTLENRSGWKLIRHDAGRSTAFPVPGPIDPHLHQQFRFRKVHGTLSFYREGSLIGQVDAPREPTSVGLYARRARVAVDMVRVTAIQ